MRIFLRTLEVIIALVILVIFILYVVGLSIARPNKIKPIISQQVYKLTGRHLTFHGDFHLSLSPVGVEVRNISLSNAAGFSAKDFANIQYANLHIYFWPLLTGKIEAKELLINGATINLEQNKQGQNNWTFLPSNSTPAKAPEKSKTTNQTTSTNDSWKFSAPRLDVKNITINWDDAQSNQHAKIEKLNLHANNIANNKFFPLNASLILHNQQPKIDGPIQLNTQTMIDLNKSQYTLDKIKLHTNITGEGLKLNTSSSGKVVISPNSSNNPLQAQIQLTADSITVMKASMQQVKATLNAKNNVITVTPISAKVYQGSYQGQLAVDMNGKTPKITAYELVKGMKIQPLLSDMYTYKKLTGTANAEGDITAYGFDAQQFLKSLNGQFQLNVLNGQMQGVDIAYYARTLVALINKQTPPKQEGANVTDFGSFNIAGPIQNGVVNLKTINLVSPVVQVNGQGQANLVTQQVNALLHATAIKGSMRNPEAISPALPIKVSGSFENLKFEPEYQSILQSVLEDQAKKTIQDKLGDKLNDLKSKLFSH